MHPDQKKFGRRTLRQFVKPAPKGTAASARVYGWGMGLIGNPRFVVGDP